DPVEWVEPDRRVYVVADQGLALFQGCVGEADSLADIHFDEPAGKGDVACGGVYPLASTHLRPLVLDPLLGLRLRAERLGDEPTVRGPDPSPPRRRAVRTVLDHRPFLSTASITSMRKRICVAIRSLAILCWDSSQHWDSMANSSSRDGF